MTTTKTTIDLRPLLAKDAEVAAEIFVDAVMNGTTNHYSEEERRAWAGPRPDPERWRDRIGGSVGLMAERNGVPVGLMTLVAPDHIDLAFVRPSAAGSGVGTALLESLRRLLNRFTRVRSYAFSENLLYPGSNTGE